ncbi:MAG: replicative DNA helicase, partial [Rhodospirillales bacterium]|nr:replicative DNA helicase [Rhodospirillales bacterium]
MTAMPATAPHNYMAEQALLGAILTNNRVFEKVGEFLRPEHFADAVHGRIFAACGTLIERGQLANPVTLSSYLSQDGILTEIGGPVYLARLVNSVVSMANVEDYGRLVLDLHRRRVIMEVGASLMEAAREVTPDETALDVAQRAVADLETLGEDSTRGQVCGLGDAVWQVLAEAEDRARNPDRDIGLCCGLHELDDKLGGLAAPDLIIIGGRPSQGKTALATGIGYHIARAGTPVALFSLEMSKGQIGGRLLAWETGLPVLRILRGRPRDDELRRLAEVST